ncbi:MAG: OPT/YSL family transporter [Candidatus Cloacimonetes bacterium]|nr:OPT/YSL family transporter [Candidatus Cloacimonadota bacterium]
MKHQEQGPYREITILGVILGILQGVVMTAAFVYAGMRLGFGIGGSTIAAIMGFAILKGVFGKGTIPENNINQTIASGINTTGSGIIFTLPVLYLMGYLGQDLQSDLKTLGLITLAATAGSFIGVAVIIPLRKQMIEFERLRFPSGTAVSIILKSPGAGPKKAILTVLGTLVSAFVAWLVLKGFLPEDLPVGQWLGLPAYTQTAIYLSLMNLGAGIMAGGGGLGFAIGGVLAYWVLAPLAVGLGWAPIPEAMSMVDGEAWQQNFVYRQMLHPLGIGMLIGGAVMGAFLALPVLKSVFKALSQAAKTAASGVKSASSEELSIKAIYGATAFAFLFLFATCYLIEKDMPLWQCFFIALAGLIWMILAGMIVAQCTGTTDTSPLSGLSLIAVTLVLFMSSHHILITVLIGVTVCVATSQCADMMQDLKTGFMVGSIPVKQQVAQLAVAWIGPVIAVATVALLWGYGSQTPGFGPGTMVPAPQAQALESMIQGVVSGNAPTEKYVTGGFLGAVLSLLPTGGLGVLIGLAMYLPFSITLGYGIGCLISMGITKCKGVDWVENNVTPFAAGLIVGEALMGLGGALIKIWDIFSPETKSIIQMICLVLVVLIVLTALVIAVLKKVLDPLWIVFGVAFLASTTAALKVSMADGKVLHTPLLLYFVPTLIISALITQVFKRRKLSNKPEKADSENVQVGAYMGPDYYLMHIRACFETMEADLITIEEVQALCLRMANERFYYMQEYGIENFARFFEPFSFAERYTNRAWSALVDGYREECRANWKFAGEQFSEALLQYEQLSQK